MVAGCGDGSSEDPEPAAASVATTVAEPVAVADDGCSPDNSPTVAAAVAGPAPAIAVRAESAANALPDLAVRRINCAPGWVNMKNEIPANRPVLVWFWAPY